MSLMKPSSCSNCEPDDDVHLMIDTPVNQVDEYSSDSTISSKVSSDSSTMNSILFEQEAMINLENCSNTYFAGYLAMKTLSKFSCPNCELSLINTDFSIENK